MRPGDSGSAISRIVCAGLAAASLDPSCALAAERLDLQCRIPKQVDRILARDLCDAVRSEIKVRFGPGTAGRTDKPAFIFELTHYRAKPMSAALSGQLRWKTGGSAQGWTSGPQVSARVTDAPFDNRILADFARQLVATGRF